MKTIVTNKSRNLSIKIEIPMGYSAEDVISRFESLLGSSIQHVYHDYAGVLFIKIWEHEIQKILQTIHTTESDSLSMLLTTFIRPLIGEGKQFFTVEETDLENALYPVCHDKVNMDLKADDLKRWEVAVEKLTGHNDYTKCDAVLDNQLLLFQNMVRPVLHKSVTSNTPYKAGDWVEIKSMKAEYLMNEWFSSDKYRQYLEKWTVKILEK